MTTTFEVHCEVFKGASFALPRECVVDVKGKEWPSLDSAVRSARTFCRKYGGPVTVTKIERGADTSFRRTEVAAVRRDAFDRVWTDTTWEGARLI
jgi:hypothetical protein